MLFKDHAPFLALKKHTNKLIVTGETQRRPDLFPVLRVLIDEKKERKWKCPRDLLRQSSDWVKRGGKW